VGDQLGREPREEFLQGLLPARQQPMDVAPVRDATPVHRCLGQLVAVDHRHLRVGVGQHPGGKQPRHAGAEHHRAIANLSAHRSHLLVAGRLRPEVARFPDQKLPGCAQRCSLVP
jgi:hypothetical protein